MRTWIGVPLVLGIGFVLGLMWKDLTAQAARAGAAPWKNGDVNADGLVDLSDCIWIINWLYLSGDPPVPIECPPAGPAALPATGQGLCYDQDGIEIDCASADFPGQDGSYRAGCPMAARFTDNGDGTVTDSCTGLMWEQDAGVGSLTWREALRHCEDLDLGGHTDWRLPNVRELQSIADYGRTAPALDPVFGSDPDGYWSSTSYLDDPGGVWYIDFYDGYVDYDYTDIEYSVRPVRTSS